LGHIYIIINNAEPSFQNVYLPGMVSQMIKQGQGGEIGNVTSMAAAEGSLVPYAGDKRGISSMSKVWDLELREYGINVNALEPRRERISAWDR
jgi:NAD(P)-dependent dehydrogenase (short-subunit alcohol dehydrogenase family)